MSLNIWVAKISTKVDQVVDTFYVQDLSGAKVEGDELILKIKKILSRSWRGLETLRLEPDGF